MITGIRHIICATVVFVALASHAQVSVRTNVDRDNILVGEPLSLTVEAYVPLGASVTWFSSDTIQHFYITRKGSIDTAEGIDGKKLVQLFTVTSFDSGQQYVPPFEIKVNDQLYYTDSIPVTVSFTPFDPQQDYRDIKDIIEVSNPSVKYVPRVIAAVALLCLAAGAFLMYKRVRNKQAVRLVPEEPALPPYEEAMKALRTLSTRKLINGEVKAYYSEMNDILRRYVSRKFTVSTFQKTNEELIRELASFGIPKEAYKSLSQSLRVSDSVKFAKYRPSEEDNRDNLQVVTSSIEILEKHETSAV